MTDRAFLDGLEQTVLPSPNVHLLAPTPRVAFQTRLADARGNVAELFQANSRMRSWELARLPSADDERVMLDWFLGGGRRYPDADLRPEAEAPMRALGTLEPRLAGLLGRFGPTGPLAPSLYAADLMVIHHDELLLMPPRGDALVLERALPGALGELAAAVRAEHRDLVEAAACVLALVVVPWRHMVRYGPRGFKRALLETGVLLSGLCRAAAENGLRPSPVLDFVDTVVDGLLENDGIERFCVAIVALSTHPRPDDGAGDPP